MSESAVEASQPSEPSARRYVGVQFRRAAALVHDFEAGELELLHDARVVVQTERGEALGWTVGVPEAREPHESGDGPPRRILRVANDHDLDRERSHETREHEALRFCALRARQLKLPMKVIAAEWAHSNEKAVFYFSSEERVDFRELVRELAQRYRLRVEMRQVGPRDEAKIIGALGPCGRETCCSSWMRAFTPVGIRMAKDQGLALNPQKVAGVCGRLLCCLAYEQETYRELRRGLPKEGKQVQTPRGPGRIVDVLVLRRRVKVDVNGEWLEFAPDELQPVVPGAAPAVATPDNASRERKPASETHEPSPVPRRERTHPKAPIPEPAAPALKSDRPEPEAGRNERPESKGRPRTEHSPRPPSRRAPDAASSGSARADAPRQEDSKKPAPAPRPAGEGAPHPHRRRRRHGPRKPGDGGPKT